MDKPGFPAGPFGRLIETEAVYRGNPAITNSSLNTFLWNEWWYQQCHVLKTSEREDTPALIFGRAFHCLVLEPKEYDARFVVYDGVRRGKEYEKFRDANAGKTVLTADEYGKLQQMAIACRDNKAAVKLLDSCAKEVVFRHMCNGNLARQCRVDGITPFNEIIDLKSCDRMEEFRYNFRRYGYHRQARWYSTLVSAVTNAPVDGFTFIAVEKSPPFRCELFRMDESLSGTADYEIRDAMVRLEECLRTNQWRHHNEEVQIISGGYRQEGA